ncbi:MAG: DUF4843 domain-containing protein [Chitinophagaceae bacterium]
MKYIYLLVLIAAMSTACTKGLKTFDGTPVVYFQYAVDIKDGNYPELFYDSSIVTFAYAPAAQKDSVLMLTVKISGDTASVDRQYKLLINDSSTAKAGKHYDIINSDFTVRAGRVLDTVYFQLHRIPEMTTQSFNIYVELQANENFGVDVEAKRPGSSTTTWVKTTRHRIKVDDILNKPKYWIDGYLGTFSRRKLYLMSDVLDIPNDKLNNTIAVADVNFYGKFMQRYLNEQRSLGNVIKEDDGSDMIMGPLVQ